MARSTALVPRPTPRVPAVPIAPVEYVSTTPDLVPICRQLMDLQVFRRFAIVSQSRANRSVEALIVQFSGGRRPDITRDERQALFKLAAKIRNRIEAAGPEWEMPNDPYGLWRRVQAHVLQSRDSRAIHDGLRTSVEHDMEALARQLPVWAWVKGVKGVAEKGLGVIIGETGDLGGYATPAKVWKRLGLAVMDEGRRQGNPGKVASAEDWTKHGYNPKRRAEVWAFLSNTMFKAQWRGDRDEDGKNSKTSGKPVAVPAHAIGPYGELYAERKAWDLARGWTPKHADNDARRIMSKRFLRDLWVAWSRQRETAIRLEPTVGLSPAAD